MNRIFKVIWSKTKHCYVVVSEYAKANTKAAHTGVRVTAAALAAAAVLLAPIDYSTVWAQTATIEVASTDGNTKTDVYTKAGADSQFATWDEVKNKADKNDVQDETKAREAADEQIKADVEKKANASDVYSKSETDSKVKEAETYTYRKVAAEEKARKEKDNELNERITNEANDIHKTTNELNDRITNVKENLQKEAADTYVSKDDAAVQDGAQVKASNKVGQNLQNLDTALAKETAARVTSEKAQNEAIATVNTNLVTAVTAINQNVSDGFAALNQADANEAAAREQADTELGNRVTTVESKTTDLSYDEKTKTTTVNDKLAADSAQITKSIAVGNNANIGGAVNAGSLNSRGNLNVDGNALVKGTLTSQSTINGKEIVSQTNITAKNKVVGMQGVVDNTLTSGAYVTAGNTVGQNINALDEQVKTNAETANQLQHSLAAEAAAREAGDNAMNDRITAVKESLQKEAADTYVSKDDASVEDGYVIKKANKIGENVALVDKALSDEVAARVTADKAQNEAIATVNTNLVTAVSAINQNVSDGFAALNQADANEATAREAADNALASRTTALEDKTEAITYDKDSKTLMVDGKLTAVEGITDGTTQNGQYVKQDNYVGQNLNALDQAIANTASQSDLTAEKAAREAGDKALSDQITNEANAIHDEIKAGDTALDNRITEVKNYLQQDVAATYVSKDDAAVEDGYVIKKANKIGENVALVDKALSDEAAARVTADKAQNEAIATVNTNLVTAVNNINQNVSDGFAALNQADANETKAREDADTALTNRIAAEETDRAEADAALQNAIDKEAADRKAADTTLQTNIDNEAAAREAADNALDSRTTALEDKTEAITYDKDSKTVMVDGKLTVTEGITDGTTQNGQYVTQDNYVGQNLNALDQGLQAETTARQAADKTLQDNIDAEAATRAAEDQKLDNKITAEKEARIGADTKLVEAVNSGLNLSNDNVIQKNTTTIAEDGTITTSKTDANEMILNKGKDNQITLNEKGIKVGTNSTVVDKDGVYTGGDTYSEAKAALKSDGSIKGADGKFTVNSANGTVNVNNQIELNGATGNVKANSLNIGDGNFKVNSNGGVTAAGGKTTLASDGSVKAADGKFTVNSNGGVKAADGKITLSSDGSVKAADGKFAVNTNGSVKAADGKFTVDSNGAVKAANGNTTIDSNGNIKTAGTLSAADGSFKVDNTGKITSTGLDAGNGTIQTTGTVKAGDVQTGTLETTSDAKIGGNLTVEKNLTVNGEFNAKTLSSKLDENNYTEIHGGNVTSKNFKMSDTGEIQASSSKLDEMGSTVWARDDESIGTSTVTADSIKQSLSKTGDSPTSYASRELSQNKDNKFEMTDRVVDGDNTNTAKKTAIESSSILAGKNGLSSTFKQNVSEILNQINKSDTEYAKVDQKVDNITSEVKNGDNFTSTTQTAADIANTAEHGTISNNAKNLTNTASENITNTSTNGNISNIAANGTINNEAKNISNKAAEALTNDAKTITNTASESVTTQIGDGSVVKSVMNENGIANTAVGKAITNDAADIINTGTNSVTNQVGTNKVLVNNDKVQTAFGDGTYTTWDASGITNNTTGNMSTTVGGDQTNDIKGSQTNTIGGSQTTNVTGDSSLTAENINNTAKNKITNKALDVETDAASSIVNKVSNDYGTNTSTQTSSQTQEEMSLEDGKTASYLRGAGEEKSQLTNGDAKTTIDTIAGQTNTNITDGTNISNNLQKADQAASSVTDGTNTTVVNQDAKSLASSITDGTKANNTSNTVDRSAQVIKVSDKQYSASSKTATAFSDMLVSGDSIVNILKDADNGFVQSNVSKGDNSTSVKQTATDITNTAKNGTIANDAKDIVNNAAENMTNTVGKDLTTTVGGDMSTTVTGNSSLSAKNISNSATEKLSNSAAEIENTATKSITSKVGDNVSSTMGTDSIVTKVGTTTVTTKDGKTKLTNKAGTHETEMDYATVLKDLGVRGNATVDQNLTVKGDSDLKGNATVGKNLTVNGTSDLKGDVTMESNATVKKDLTVKGTTTTDTLHVTSKSTFDGPATFKDVVTMEKDLTVGGNAAVTGSVTATSYKVGDTTYIDGNGINANNQKVTNVAAGDLSAASTDAVNGSQLYSTNQRVSTVENRVDGVENRVTNVENRVDKMDSRIDKVGANASAMANLHPLEFDEDSKWNVAAAVGNYKGETAAAVGAFYRPNEDVMFNLSTTFGNDENMVGGGVSLRLGKGGNHEKDKKLKAALAENNDLRSKVDNLTARMDALLSVLNPSMSKDFPDVPANHWAYEAVSRLAGNDIVQGYADGKFHGERTMTRYEMAEIIYNALSKGAKAEKKLVEEFKPELQAMAAQKQAK